MKTFNAGDRIYYNNQDCEFRTMIDESTALVTMIVGFGHGEDSDYTTLDIPVDISRLSTHKVDLDKEFNEKHKSMIKRYEEDRTNIMKEVNALRMQREDLLKNAKKYEALGEVVDLIEGTFTHAVFEESYRRGMCKIENLKCSYDERELAVISYRKKGKERFECFVGSYSDDSGGKTRIKLFKSEAEAVAHYITKIEEWVKTNESQYVEMKHIEQCGGLDKFSQTVKDMFKKRENYEREAKEKERKKLESQLAALSK